jgi:riboflavin synthase
MFTGIIEAIGTVTDILTNGTNKTFWISSPISNEFTIDQSVSHNGACLTIEEVKNGAHRITAIEETLVKTNLNTWLKGSIVNLERCLPMNGRLDGHIVQGHVDTTAQCTEILEKAGSYEYRFSFNKKFASLIIEKGSISLNGISLTIFNITETAFTAAIIPYTFEHTDIKHLRVNGLVNIEFDLIGKYVDRFMQLRQNP